MSRREYITQLIAAALITGLTLALVAAVAIWATPDWSWPL